MTVKDYSYYKKNVLGRYLLSKELADHRDIIKLEKAKKFNDFIIPAFSASLTIASGYFINVLQITNSFLLRMLFVAFSFIIAYYIAVGAIKLFNYIKAYFKLWFFNADVKPTENEGKDIIDHFNIDIVNQILLSYTLLQESRDTEIEKAVDEMNEMVFTEGNISIIFNKSNFIIARYRIEHFLDLFRETYSSIGMSGLINNIEFSGNLKLVRDTYNGIVNRLPNDINLQKIL